MLGHAVAARAAITLARAAASRTSVAAAVATREPSGLPVGVSRRWCANSTLVQLPVVDLSSPDGPRTAAAVARACETSGFLVVTGHGVPRGVVDAVWRATDDFFDGSRTPPSIRRTAAAPAGYPYGYCEPATEALSRSAGEESPPDLKETFSIGPLAPPPPQELPNDPVARFAFAPNLWPTGKPAFRAALEAYYTAAHGLSCRLLDVAGVALDAEPGWWKPMFTHHMSALRLNNYPAVPTKPASKNQWRAGPHSDYGTVTVLLPQYGPEGSGLEMLIGDEWFAIDATAIPQHAFVINIGDMMSFMSGGKWKSTVHRVVVPCDTKYPIPRRQSVAFFHQPNWDARLSPISRDAAAYPDSAQLTAGKHIKGKFEAAGFIVHSQFQ